MMLFLFYMMIKNSKSFWFNFIIGFLVALMFAQRAVSFFYILPMIIYFIILNKKNFKSLVFLILGFASLMFSIGYNNYDKTGTFYLIPSKINTTHIIIILGLEYTRILTIYHVKKLMIS